MSQVVENELQVGDLVRVIAPDSLLHGLEGRIAQTDFGAGEDPYKFESACGEHRGWLSAYQLRKLTVSSVEGEPHRDGLVLRSEWNAKEGCFEYSRVDPEKESHWEPKPYEWVRLPDQTVLPVHGYEIHGGKTYYCFEGTNDKFALGFLRPWVPRRGEKVQVINANQVYEVQSFDQTTKVVFCVGRYAGIQLRLLKPYIEQPAKEPAEPATDHIADADKMVPLAIPAGWRELNEGELLSIHDLFDFEGEWTACKYDPIGDIYNSRIHKRHIRKIEQSPGHVQGVWVEEGSEKPSSVTWYRDPTQSDLANGPIEVEVCDDTNCDLNWQKRQLYAVLPSKCMFPYVVNDPGDEEFTQHWRHARIKVKATLHIKSDTRDVENLLSDAEVINAMSINFEPKRPLVYIAGPMRGIPHFNFPDFDAAKAYLMEKGYDVLSPADFDRELDGFDPYKPEYETAEGCADFPKTMDFKRVVTRDLTAVTQCDAVALLSGWEKSKGAVAEIAVAHWMGKPVMHLLCDAHRSNEVVYIVNNDSTTLEQFVLQLAHAHDAYDKRINCAIDTPPPEQNPDCDILEVAASITRGDRQAVYGPPNQDFKKTADMWTGMFQYMLADGAKFEPRHVAMAMICIKLSREFHQRKRDNWIDIAGYARCGSLCSS